MEVQKRGWLTTPAYWPGVCTTAIFVEGGVFEPVLRKPPHGLLIQCCNVYVNVVNVILFVWGLPLVLCYFFPPHRVFRVRTEGWA